jgi:hypothetical protein
VRARRCWAQSIAGLLLVLVTAALVTVYLPVELDSPAFYNGDGDDAGGVWKPVAIWRDLVSTDLDQALAPTPYAHRTLPAQPTDVLPGPPPPLRLASRAPPA